VASLGITPAHCPASTDVIIENMMKRILTRPRWKRSYRIDLSWRGSQNEDGSLPIKDPASVKVVSYARICLIAKFQLKKSILKTKPASVIGLHIGFV
jgi:hypothetical protein